MRSYQGNIPRLHEPRGKKTRRKGRLVAMALLTPALLLAVLWGAAAIWFDGPASRGMAGFLAALLTLGCAVVLLRVRPFRRAVLAVLAVFGVVLAWWLTIPPSNTRPWLPDVARTASAIISGSRVTIHNVRNFDYRSETDYTERWETRAYDLDKLRGVDLFLSYWGPTLIAHTIASWEFADGSHLAISIETRKEKGEDYSAVKGFFRQYELYYVVADERDLVRLRTNYRGERVYLYRMKIPAEMARKLLLDYLAEINRLAEKPRWYNALTHNCTTAIRYHMKNLGRAGKFDWRILANGRVDELLYLRGSTDRSIPYPEFRKRSEITERAKAADHDRNFSALIREGLPGER